MRPTQAGARQTANKEQEKVTPEAVRTTQNQTLLNIYSKITFLTSREIHRNKLYHILVDDYSLNIDDINNFGSLGLLDFAGLCWPSLALDKFCKQKLAFFVKIKHY